MRRRIISLIVMICLLAASVVTYMLIGNKKAPDKSVTPAPTAAPDNRTEIFKFSVGDTKTLTIKNPGKKDVVLGHTLQVQNEDNIDVWTLVADPFAKLDETECNTVFGVMSDLKGTKMTAEALKDTKPENFGFDKASLVTVVMNDGTQYKIEVGDYAPMSSGAYARVPGNTDVYIIGLGEAAYLKSEEKAFRNKTLFIKDEKTDISKIRYVKNGVLQFVMTSKKSNDLLTWDIVEPISWSVKSGDEARFIAIFNGITAEDIVDESTTNLEKYGLKNPAYDITFTYNGKDNRLLLGSKDETGTFYYATFNGSKEIYTLPVQSLADIDITLPQMITQVVYSPSYTDLSKLQVTIDNKDYVFEIKNDTGDKTNDVLVFEGKTITDKDNPTLTTAFRNLYKGTLGLWMNDIDPTAKPAGTPEIRLIFTNKKANETVTIEYIKKNAVSYYIMKNGKYTGLVTNASNADRDAKDIVPGLRPTIKIFVDEFYKIK